MKFTEFELNEQLLEAIDYMGFENTTPIQEKAIPEILKGNDLIACAQTGTGKTAAFLLPMLHKLIDNESKNIDALILVPTRELAMQIDQQIQGIAYSTNITAATIFGGGDGDDWVQQRTALTQGASIIVAAPGKLISHLAMGYAKFDNLKYLILDEADRMLDIGFHDDIMKILSYLPKKRQTLLFSATMPPKVRKFANKILHKPVEVNIANAVPAEGILQAGYFIHESDKTSLIHHLLKDKQDYNRILIFSSTRKKVQDIVRSLKRNNYNTEGISSDLEQKERNEVMLRFQSKETRILVATDVLSRGIDIKNIELIINYDVPNDPEDYVHRIGRTARAESTGVALTFINKDDMQKLHRIERLLQKEIPKMPLPPEVGVSPDFKSTKHSGSPSNRRNKSGKQKKVKSSK
jgi:superfamily II DNA/RNA helicase